CSISVRFVRVPWNCVSGPFKSGGSTPSSNGHTRLLSKDFEMAPASKRSQSALRLDGVRQMTPTWHEFNFAAISELHRAPLSMSAEETQGTTPLRIWGTHFRTPPATPLLRSPAKLMNTPIDAFSLSWHGMKNAQIRQLTSRPPTPAPATAAQAPP